VISCARREKKKKIKDKRSEKKDLDAYLWRVHNIMDDISELNARSINKQNMFIIILLLLSFDFLLVYEKLDRLLKRS
jgi:hypothetical protein